MVPINFTRIDKVIIIYSSKVNNIYMVDDQSIVLLEIITQYFF